MDKRFTQGFKINLERKGARTQRTRFSNWPQGRENFRFLPILKLGKFAVDLLDVDVLPVDVVVAVDAHHDGVVEAVELLQQGQLLAVDLQRRIVGRRQAEQNLAAGNRLVSAPHIVELRLQRSPRYTYRPRRCSSLATAADCWHGRPCGSLGRTLSKSNTRRYGRIAVLLLYPMRLHGVSTESHGVAIVFERFPHVT